MNKPPVSPTPESPESPTPMTPEIKFFFEDCARTQALLSEVPKMAAALKSSIEVSSTEGLAKVVAWRISIRTPEMNPGAKRFRLSKRVVAPSKEVAYLCQIDIDQRISELPSRRPKGFTLLFWISIRFPKEQSFPVSPKRNLSFQFDRSGLGLYFTLPERWQSISHDALASFLDILLRVGEVKDALISSLEGRKK